MRISDWSSDVCSSDLTEAQALLKAEGLRASRDAIRALTDAAAGDRAILAGEIAKLALYLDASPEHPKSVEPPVVAALVSGHSESDLGALVNAVLGGQPGEAERQIANRSEEHTSELQSLMRLSYAVFCLKKKKIKPN